MEIKIVIKAIPEGPGQVGELIRVVPKVFIQPLPDLAGAKCRLAPFLDPGGQVR
jgi:hypothetical protein